MTEPAAPQPRADALSAALEKSLRLLRAHPDLDELRYAASTGAFLTRATDTDGERPLKPRAVRAALLEAFGAIDDTHPDRQAAERIIKQAFGEAKRQAAEVDERAARSRARDARRAELVELEQDRREARREADRLERGDRLALAHALLDVDALDAEPDLSPLIDGVLFAGSLAFLVGDSGIGKSAFAISMALAVASDRDWLGHPVEAGSVLYIAGEGGAGLPKRVRAEREAWGGERPDFVVLRTQLDLGDDRIVDELVALNEAHDFTLIVYDTLNRHAGDAEENSATAMGRVVRGIDRIAAAGTSTTSLVLHHNGKSGDIRGSSALYASADTVLDLAGTPDALTLKASKQKDAEGGSVGVYRLRAMAEHDTVIVEGSTMLRPAGGIAPGRVEEAMQLFERAFADAPIAKSTWVSSLQESLGVGKTAAYEITKALVASGHLRQAPGPGSTQRLELGTARITFPITESETTK